VRQLVNKDFDSIKLHGKTMKTMEVLKVSFGSVSLLLFESQRTVEFKMLEVSSKRHFQESINSVKLYGTSALYVVQNHATGEAYYQSRV
jgi:hypothetical protein